MQLRHFGSRFQLLRAPQLVLAYDRSRCVGATHKRFSASSAIKAYDYAAGATVLAPTEQAMARLAQLFAAQGINPGDCYCLYGEVGAGKSVFSRAFIRAAANDKHLPVPSPTYLLQNIYDADSCDGLAIHHFDLYRLSGNNGQDLQRLALDDSFRDAVCLIEWSERLPADALPLQHVSIHIDITEAPVSTSLPAPPSNTPASPASALHVVRLQGGSVDVHTGAAQGCTQTQGLEHGEQGMDCQHATSSTAENDFESDSEASDEEEDDVYSDKRWRRVTLIPHGEAWQSRLKVLLRQLEDLQMSGLHRATHGLQTLPTDYGNLSLN